ncbi:VWA domain-containing protein [Streptomyces sp. YS415]|uniref:VWA domain-containing protein n=1 Tax=Streptomyces sp. YS415 TaxID=2944806 RepID=UPI002022811E|nr:VWA domain-containing protein [Streptomyces sp. YS415]MCL7428903.1 VWA domain-containing protein [Streptomyces sp. YS415]
MGILTLLRNALGRTRKGRTAEAEGAEGTKPTVPTQPAPTATPDPTPAAETPATTPAAETPAPAPAQVPEPRPATDDHELVAAAFDNVTVPKQTAPPTAAERVAEPAAETAEQAAEREPKAETPEPVAEPTAETAEPVIDREPEAETPVAEPESQTPEPEKPVVVIELEPELETPEPVTEREPEPVAEAEPEPVAETAEPVTETAKPDAKTAEPVAVAEPEPAVEAETAAEPKAAVEPKAAAEPEPAAADGEEAPQGPPAADNETRTGGAGGNDPAEGEAEAEQTPTPATTSPATTLTQLKTAAPSLATAYRAATTTLKKNDLTGTRAKVHLVLDRSASMRPYYKDGSAQALAEQTLALAAHLDPEATVHVTFFSTELDGTGELTLTNHENKIDELHAALGRMGRTSYHVAVEEVVTHHEKTTSDDPDAPRTPALVIFQTDGAPDAKTPATQALTDAAKNHPHIHFAFVAFGEHDNKAFDYLRKLKTGNTSFFHAGPTPRELTDTELYTGVLANWKP